MNLTVEYKDASGAISQQTHSMSRLAFAKHFAIVGQRYAPSTEKFFRTLGMFLHYSQYLKKEGFDNDQFSLPPNELSDPTEKGQFSNLAGKAIADFLSKQIDRSLYTVNYEAALRMLNEPIVGARPDLIAFRQNTGGRNVMFAIECKGYSGGHGDMDKHKDQSQTGKISVNFSVACVSYNLYNQVKCKYHDPINEDIEYDYQLLKELTKDYYSGLSTFIDDKLFEINETIIQGETFYEISISKNFFEKLYPKMLNPKTARFFKFYPKLILPKDILDYAKNGVGKDVTPFIFKSTKENENIYIDNDRVGIKIENKFFSKYLSI